MQTMASAWYRQVGSGGHVEQRWSKLLQADVWPTHERRSTRNHRLERVHLLV
jgi:hypothetical protein